MGAWDLGHQRGSVSFFAFCVRPVYMYKLHDEQGRKASVFFQSTSYDEWGRRCCMLWA
jgi:hypothetical protein